jgi:hypothetical protein
VVHDLKALQAFFRELEDTGEIRRSPFKKISFEKRRSIMHVMYDAPFFLKAGELKRGMRTGGPAPRGFGRRVPIYEFGVVRPVFLAPSGL